MQNHVRFRVWRILTWRVDDSFQVVPPHHGTCNNPVTVLERLENLLTFGFRKRLCSAPFVVGFGAAALSSG